MNRLLRVECEQQAVDSIDVVRRWSVQQAVEANN